MGARASGSYLEVIVFRPCFSVEHRTGSKLSKQSPNVLHNFAQLQITISVGFRGASTSGGARVSEESISEAHFVLQMVVQDYIEKLLELHHPEVSCLGICKLIDCA